MFALLLFNISYSPLLQSLVQDFVFIFMYVEIRVAHLLQDFRYCIQTKVGIHTDVSASFVVQHEKTVILRLLFEPPLCLSHQKLLFPITKSCFEKSQFSVNYTMAIGVEESSLLH